MDTHDSISTFLSMKEVSRKVAARMGWENEQERWDMIRLWVTALGNPVARVSYPQSVHPEEIVVAVESALWKRELTYLLPEIRGRLAEVDPSAGKKNFTFRVVRPFLHPLTRQEPPGVLSPEQVDRLWIRAGEIAGSLPDSLKSRGQAFVFKQMVNGIHLEKKPS
jgi:hypothetical protein